MSTKGCENCKSFTGESEDYCAPSYYCSTTNLGNLKSFPFKKTMPCFQLNFWFSDFAYLINPDLGIEREKMIHSLWKKADKFGRLTNPADITEFERLK